MKLKHSNERPWQCDICFKSYKLKHHLKAHMETKHASAKPFPCKLCDFSCIDVRTLNKHIFNNHRNHDPPEDGQRMTGGAGGPMRAQVLPNTVRMDRPYDHSGISNNPLARKDMAGPNGYLANQPAGQNPAPTQNKMKPNQMLNPLASYPVALMAQMNLQLAASMRQLQSQIQQQIQAAISTPSPLPATSMLSQHAQLQQMMGNNQNAHMQPLRCEHCQITFPDQIMYMAHMDMHKRQPYPKGNLFYQPYQCSRCSHICKDRTEFFLHWRNDECNN